MPVLNYEVSADELNDDFVQAIKTLFKGKKVRISVREGVGSSGSSSIWDVIERNEKSPYTYQFSAEEFSSMVKEVSSNENYDLEAAFERHKILKADAKTTN
ncbi:MAG: hypothetical protein KIS77_06970 [Saprospiraceae bacterium]|nr:hypothetical protein [Saprospiraceae bacterium]